MPRNFSDHQEREDKEGPPAGGGRSSANSLLSTLKGYLIIILLAALVLTGVKSYIPARSEWGGGCGGCITRGGAPVSVEQLRRLGMEYYAANYGASAVDAAVEAKVRDFGCHQEIYILKDGQLVLRLAYQRGDLYELPEV